MIETKVKKLAKVVKGNYVSLTYTNYAGSPFWTLYDSQYGFHSTYDTDVDLIRELNLRIKMLGDENA